MPVAGTIQLRHPQPHDPVGESFLLAGLGSGFEGTVNYRIVGSEGAVLCEGFFQAGTFAMTDFAHRVELPADAPGREATVEVFWVSPADPEEDPEGPERDKVTVPITLAATFLPGFTGWNPYVVRSGDTLWAIANRAGETITAQHVFDCNRDQLSNPDLIHPGQVLRVPSTS